MPINEYTCPECGKDFELIQNFNGTSTLDCPHCQAHGDKIKKISCPGVAIVSGGTHAQRAG